MKAATGEDVTAEELGGADVHTRHLRRRRPLRRRRRARARSIARDDRRRRSTARKPLPADRVAPEDRRATTRRSSTASSPTDLRKPYDVREVIARLVDGSRFDEFKARYGTTLVTGFARIHGYLGRHPRQQRRAVLGVGAQGDALHRAVQPCAASRWCSCRTSPASWSAGSTSAAASPRTAPRWCTPWPTRVVPKFTVVIGGSFGAGNYGMCGRAYDPRFLWMWPNARISVMGGEQAAGVLATVKRDQLAREGKTLSAEDEAAIRDPILDQVRARGLALLLHRAAVGRRHPRPGRHARRAGARPLGRAATRRSRRPRFGVFRM